MTTTQELPVEEVQDKAVISAPAATPTTSCSVRCSVCGVTQQLVSDHAEVGEWMPCRLCWLAMSRERRLSLLPRFKMLAPEAQRPWQHRFKLIGVPEEELRREVEPEQSADAVSFLAACQAPHDAQATSSPGDGTDAEPDRCRACGGILFMGVHAA